MLLSMDVDDRENLENITLDGRLESAINAAQLV